MGTPGTRVCLDVGGHRLADADIGNRFSQHSVDERALADSGLPGNHHVDGREVGPLLALSNAAAIGTLTRGMHPRAETVEFARVVVTGAFGVVECAPCSVSLFGRRVLVELGNDLEFVDGATEVGELRLCASQPVVSCGNDGPYELRGGVSCQVVVGENIDLDQVRQHSVGAASLGRRVGRKGHSCGVVAARSERVSPEQDVPGFCSGSGRATASHTCKANCRPPGRQACCQQRERCAAAGKEPEPGPIDVLGCQPSRARRDFAVEFVQEFPVDGSSQCVDDGAQLLVANLLLVQDVGGPWVEARQLDRQQDRAFAARDSLQDARDERPVHEERLDRLEWGIAKSPTHGRRPPRTSYSSSSGSRSTEGRSSSEPSSSRWHARCTSSPYWRTTGALASRSGASGSRSRSCTINHHLVATRTNDSSSVRRKRSATRSAEVLVTRRAR